MARSHKENVGEFEHYCRSCINFFKVTKPMADIDLLVACPNCGQMAKRRKYHGISRMGFNFLKDKSEKSPPAPTDSGYHKEWDQAYGPTRSGDTIKA